MENCFGGFLIGINILCNNSFNEKSVDIMEKNKCPVCNGKVVGTKYTYGKNRGDFMKFRCTKCRYEFRKDGELRGFFGYDEIAKNNESNLL